MSKHSIPKIDSLTSLRGYFAVWVVIFHFWVDFRVFFPQLEFLTPVSFSGYLAVPGFFMLSGFVIVFNYGHIFKKISLKKSYYFLLMRLTRVYPVHIVTLFMVLGYNILRDYMGYAPQPGGFSLREFILNLFLVHTWVPQFTLSWNHPSWSLSSEWFAYILFPFMAVFIFATLKRIRSVLCLGISSLIVAMLWMLWREHVYFFELLIVVPLFIVGGCIFYLSVMLKGSSPQCMVSKRSRNLLVWLPVLFIFGGCYFSESIKIPILFASMAVLIFALAFTAGRPSLFWTSAVPLYIGDVSYSLYMSHTLIQKVVYKLLPVQKFADAHWITKSAVGLSYILVIFIFCLLIYYTVEKPCLRYFRKKIPKI